ncbi:MAG TPA: hypothetical protein VFS20_20355 [Longimicrobium sp.]|nr:hypothetical protein [Longimicrobium sp.]
MLIMLFEAEIDAALHPALGAPYAVRAFWPTMGNGFGLPPEAAVSIEEALDVMASAPESRVGLERQAV